MTVILYLTLHQQTLVVTTLLSIVRSILPQELDPLSQLIVSLLQLGNLMLIVLQLSTLEGVDHLHLAE
jgi:hypothetical protein